MKAPLEKSLTTSARRPKVALVCDWFLPRIGGIELHIADLAQELTNRGYEVCVITTTPGPDDCNGIPVHRLNEVFIPGVPVTAPFLWKVIGYRRLLEREGIDVVHAHGMFSTLGMLCILAAHYSGIPSVTTHHSLIQGILRPLARAIFDVAIRRVDVVTAVSEAAAADARWVSRKEQVEVLPNGINPDDWQHAEPTEDEIHIVSVMRLTQKKDPHELIRVIPEIVARTPNSPPLRFTVVGDGPEREHLERMICDLSLQDCVDFVGYKPRLDINKVMRHCSLFVSPCSNEAFGVALLEARCAGIPVVAMNHGGTDEVIQHGVHGFLANDYREFVDHTVRLTGDQRLRQRMMYEARKGVDEFCWDAVIDRHVGVYEQAQSACERG